MSTGVQREFNVNILYQIKQGGSYTKDVFKQVSNNVERLKRLIFNNSSYNNGSTWFDAKITTVNYERDEDDNSIFKANINFNCQNIEVI
jgi:membrane-bound lytic murein transglycosylase MltF